MKRILHISTYYPPHTGGIEDVCRSMVGFLSAFPEVEQRVFCFNDRRKSVIEECEGIRVVRAGRVAKVASQSISLSYMRLLRREVGDFRPDIIHFHAPNPLAAACLLAVLPKGVRLIVHWHSDIVAQKILYRIIRPVETALLRRADVVVATSENYISHSRPLEPFAEKCVVIPNIVDTSKLVSDDALVEAIRRKYCNKPLVLFVGRHVKYKGLDYLLHAAQMVESDCRFIIGGTGPLTEKLMRDYPSANIHFVGRIPDSELASYYRAADVFAFPSVTKNEAFGIALAEAMYCRTPAVTFNIAGSGVNWVNLDGVTGLEVENGNAEKLAEAIDLLLGDNALRCEYGENACRRVEELMRSDKISGVLKSLYRL